MKKHPSKRKKTVARSYVVVRALRTVQAEGVSVFSFFIPKVEIARIAEISGVERAKKDSLPRFQRREIRQHVGAIANFLNQGKLLFPNAIILAMSPDVRFLRSRGPTPDGVAQGVDAGVLKIPIRSKGDRVAWIVEEQRRALAQGDWSDLPIPVVAFISDDIAVQREQFILVNKARPLPTRLINELLPETGGAKPLRRKKQ